MYKKKRITVVVPEQDLSLPPLSRLPGKGGMTLEDRFWTHVRKIDDETSCWEWQAAFSTSGYGVIGRGAGPLGLVRAHRLSYGLAFLNGYEPPKAMFVCHRCDNKKCVRPDHLAVGTHRENTLDMMSKVRGTQGERSHYAKLTESQVKEIVSLRGTANAVQISARYNVQPRQISRIWRGERWRHVTNPESIAFSFNDSNGAKDK